MNKLQANIALICVTLCWSTEVIIFSNIPDTVAPFATTCITNLIAAALLFASFFKRVRLEFSRGKTKILKRCLFLGVLNCAYNLMLLYGLKYFNVTMGAFIISPVVELFYPVVDSSFFGVTVVGNAIGFPFLIGIPMIILMQEELGFRVRPWEGRMDGTIQRQTS